MNNLNILNNSTDCNNQIFIPHMCAYTIRVDRWFVIIIYICTYIIIYFTTYAPVKYCTLIMCNPKLHEGNLNFWFSTQKQRLNSLSFKSSISGSWLIFLIAENCSTLSQCPALVLFDTFTVMIKFFEFGYNQHKIRQIHSCWLFHRWSMHFKKSSVTQCCWLFHSA